MNEYDEPTAWEAAITQLAREYAYPPTPDLAVTIGHSLRNTRTTPREGRAPSWAVGLAIAIAILLLGTLAVPQTRAAVLTFIGRIGGIRLFVDESEPPLPTAMPTGDVPVSVDTDDGTPTRPATATPVPLALLAAVPGEPVGLDELGERVDFPVWLPPQRSEWGLPDAAVTHHISDRTLVSFIWDDPDQPGRPVLTLSQSDIPELAYKMFGADQMTEVNVNGNKGMWITGPHRLQLPIDGSSNAYVASNVLIWSDARMTYRIEGDLTMADALRLAESLSPDNSP